MERRIMSSVNPYVGARYPVHCSCCDSEVRPAISIERGKAVVAMSLVEPVNQIITKIKPMATVTIPKVIGVEVNSGNNEPQTINLTNNNNLGNAGVLHTMEEVKTAMPMNIPIEEVEVTGSNAETKTINLVTSSEEKASNTIDEAEMVVQEQSDEQSDEELETSDADEIQTTCMVPRRVCRNIRLALDKARFCLQKINCATSKRFQELSREERGQVEALKKLATESLEKQNYSIVDEMCLVSERFIENMEYSKENMLDCQQKSLLDIIATLEQDVGNEFSCVGQTDFQENEQERDQTWETSSNDSLMTFLKDTPWTLFGFISLAVANLGYFSQPWLLQSFQMCIVRYLDYFRNSTSFQ